MKILITNLCLSGRSGTETYVRDLAIGLLERGHTPIVYAPDNGPIATELRNLTIPVVSDLGLISGSVDIIHGHHRHQTMTALLFFQGVPAVFFIHDWHAWHDMPLIFPRILHYVAVDKTRYDRAVVENGVPEEKISILMNGVDTKRFLPRMPLPKKPKRAVVFSSYVKNKKDIHDLEIACKSTGLSLDVIGSGMNSMVHNPENVLCEYDLVFAIGRSALEAMAVGAGVIIWGVEGLGGFVNQNNFKHYQECNFGRRLLRQVSVSSLVTEIQRYNPIEARWVQDKVRAEHGQGNLVERHLALYARVINESKLVEYDPLSELRIASKYLEECIPVHSENSYHFGLEISKRRHRRRLLDVVWITLSALIVGYMMRVDMVALNSNAYGLIISSVPICILTVFLLFQLRMQLKGKL